MSNNLLIIQKSLFFRFLNDAYNMLSDDLFTLELFYIQNNMDLWAKKRLLLAQLEYIRSNISEYLFKYKIQNKFYFYDFLLFPNYLNYNTLSFIDIDNSVFFNSLRTLKVQYNLYKKKITLRHYFSFRKYRWLNLVFFWFIILFNDIFIMSLKGLFLFWLKHLVLINFSFLSIPFHMNFSFNYFSFYGDNSKYNIFGFLFFNPRFFIRTFFYHYSYFFIFLTKKRKNKFYHYFSFFSFNPKWLLTKKNPLIVLKKFLKWYI